MGPLAMAEEDFDVESLAAYLHVEASQVQRLVERGKLPARKVSGSWRFSQAEVHHWLESRIGLSSDDELLQMEGVLERLPGRSEPRISRPSRLSRCCRSRELPFPCTLARVAR